LYGLPLYGAGGFMTALQPVQSYRELLPEDLTELWEERAAIMEYEGGLSREDAEWQAFLCVQGDV
jgi:hypothetical protein